MACWLDGLTCQIRAFRALWPSLRRWTNVVHCFTRTVTCRELAKRTPWPASSLPGLTGETAPL
jgi:hypothetical protein